MWSKQASLQQAFTVFCTPSNCKYIRYNLPFQINWHTQVFLCPACRDFSLKTALGPVETILRTLPFLFLGARIGGKGNLHDAWEIVQLHRINHAGSERRPVRGRWKRASTLLLVGVTTWSQERSFLEKHTHMHTHVRAHGAAEKGDRKGKIWVEKPRPPGTSTFRRQFSCQWVNRKCE